jgi:outer membrane protein OmpA-like peptidoglycan-associated protein
MIINIKRGLLLTSCVFLFSCASPKKAELQSSNPQEAIESVQMLRKSLIESNADVLAKSQYDRGDSDFKRATESFKSNESSEVVMSQLAQAKAYYLEAQATAKTRKIVPENVMSARQSAINVRLLKSGTLKSKLGKLDKSLLSASGAFSKNLSVEELSKYQGKYLKLEVEAVQNNQLGAFRRIVKKSEKNDASDLAPKTLRRAQTQINVAENLINQSPRDPSQYRESVDQANKSAKFLDDVMNKLSGEAKGSTEGVALKLVYQERILGKLSHKVEDLEGTLATTNSQVGSMSKELVEKRGEVLSAENKVRFQEAMDQVSKNFVNGEASVYQQGHKLIIRVKDINFKSGSSAIPASSMSLLSKISLIVSDLNPEEVVIEGHTDSTGNQNSNLMLSNKRAEAVKKYLSSLDVKYPVDARGYGESNPIANNQTKDGRSMNRRVDIVVNAVNDEQL